MSLITDETLRDLTIFWIIFFPWQVVDIFIYCKYQVCQIIKIHKCRFIETIMHCNYLRAIFKYFIKGKVFLSYVKIICSWLVVKEKNYKILSNTVGHVSDMLLVFYYTSQKTDVIVFLSLS